MIACPLCGNKTLVVETRATRTSARRRRRCTVAGCEGKVTTVEVVVTDGKAAALASGSVMVSVRHLEKLQKIVAAIGGGVG